jgi:hypothetical protein
MESVVFHNNPTIHQINGFIDGEKSGEGLGEMSNNGRLVRTIKVNGYDHGFYNHWFADKVSLNSAWHEVQGFLNPDILDPRTLNQNLFGYSYPGPNNPKTYAGNDDYTYVPRNPMELPGMLHDLQYEKLQIAGANGLLNSEEALGADAQFVVLHMVMALDPRIGGSLTQLKSFALGAGLGMLATPKAMRSMLPRRVSQPSNANEKNKNTKDE